MKNVSVVTRGMVASSYGQHLIWEPVGEADACRRPTYELRDYRATKTSDGLLMRVTKSNTRHTLVVASETSTIVALVGLGLGRRAMDDMSTIVPTAAIAPPSEQGRAERISSRVRLPLLLLAPMGESDGESNSSARCKLAW